MERLKASPPFTYVTVDLLGPYAIRGEVQKRTAGKGYGVIFSDLFSRAIHIEGVFGYDTLSLILALVRFTSVQGWSSKIYSDPGLQLFGACNELHEVYNDLDKDQIYKTSANNGTGWIFGPADSP